MLYLRVLKAAKVGQRAARRVSRAPEGARSQAQRGQARIPAGDMQGRGGQFAPKTFAMALREAGIPAGQDPSERLKLKAKAKERAFRGQQEKTPKKLVLGGPGKQWEVGNRGEALALAYVQQEVTPAAVLLKQPGISDNFPFDAAGYVSGQGVVLWEVKTGQPSNTKSGWQWRITMDYALKGDAAKLAGKAKVDRQDLRRRQQAEAANRKAKVVAAIERALRASGVLKTGEGVRVETIGVIFDNQRGVADIHQMPDVEHRTGWSSERAAEGYRGSFFFTIKKAAEEDIARLWGDALERDLMAMVPKVVAALTKVIAQGRKGEPKPENAAPLAKVQIEVAKDEAAGDMRYIGGWASVIEVDGKPLVDRQEDVIEQDELLKAAHDFMRSYRRGKVQHKGEPDQVEYVESLVFTPDVQKALGVDLGKVGWWIGGFVKSDDAWADVKGGKLRTLSIGGKAVREKIEP